MKLKSLNYLLALAAFIAASPRADATLVLTQAGTDLGFSLTTFVSGYSAQYGPLSQGVLSNGNIITGSLLNSRIYVFSDVNNQTLSNALISVPYSCETGNCNFSMTTAAGQVYGAQAFGGVFYKFGNDGSLVEIPNLKAQGLRGYLGMWANSTNGHLIASSNFGLVDIDPIAGSYRVINANLFPDGVSVSPDGTVAYLAIGAGVQSYSVATGALISTFAMGGGPDGTGVISGGALDGRVVVNLNNGTVILLDATKAVGDPTRQVVIATGGTRGDFVSPDTSNGTLFLSQNEQVARLSCGAGCSIGSTPPPPSGVPEPSAIFLVGAGIVTLGLKRRFR
jgi:hypothetical protein